MKFKKSLVSLKTVHPKTEIVFRIIRWLYFINSNYSMNDNKLKLNNNVIIKTRTKHNLYAVTCKMSPRVGKVKLTKYITLKGT